MIARSPEYLAFVRAHICCGCGVAGEHTPEERLDPHHYMEGGSGTALKPSDYHTVPLCRTCHDAFHEDAVLPCFAGERSAVVLTRCLVYRTQARLLEQWLTCF